MTLSIPEQIKQDQDEALRTIRKVAEQYEATDPARAAASDTED